MDLKVDSNDDFKLDNYSFEQTSAADDSKDDDVFSSIDRVLRQIKDNKESRQINPWTAFLLIWITRRDEMNHIGSKKTDIEQIQVVLEFIYLFTRGCMQKFDNHRGEYSLLLCTLYNLAMNEEKDHEDVKYKMCLETMRVIGDKEVDFKNKHSVTQFIQSHQWLQNVSGKSKMSTIKQYILKGTLCARQKSFVTNYYTGCRAEFQRVHDSLNKYYKKVLFRDVRYEDLIQIKTKNNVKTPMDTQTAEKVQGKTTWGPRQGTKYDPSGFNLVCANREIDPVPKPKLNPGDFDECYMLFCLALAERLNPHFQRYIKIATKGLDCKHYAAPIKSDKKCYELMTRELKNKSSPKAARILDFCKCTLSFENPNHLIQGFEALDKKFRICRIANYFGQNARKSLNNYKYMNVYIVCKHPTCKYNKLICEVRLSLDYVQNLQDDREQVKDCFSSMLQPSEIVDIMKEVAKGAKESK